MTIFILGVFWDTSDLDSMTIFISGEYSGTHRIQIQGVPEYSPQMKIVRESKSEVSQNKPQNENCQRVQIQGVPEYPPKIKIVRESKSEMSQNTPPQNENCHRIQI